MDKLELRAQWEAGKPLRDAQAREAKEQSREAKEHVKYLKSMQPKPYKRLKETLHPTTVAWRLRMALQALEELHLPRKEKAKRKKAIYQASASKYEWVTPPPFVGEISLNIDELQELNKGLEHLPKA